MNPMPPKNCIAFSDLTVGYDGYDGYDGHAAVHHLNGEILRGSLTVIAGPNGSGKTTLIKCVADLFRPISGSCRVAPGLSTASLPQLSELDRSFPARVKALVALGLWQKRGLLGRHRAEDRQAVADALRAVGLGGFDARPIDSPSGGQLQRALFARVLVQDAALILLDEPFNAVDEKTTRDLIRLIYRWHGEGRTVVVHALDLVRAEFPQARLLARAPSPGAPPLGSLRPRTCSAFASSRKPGAKRHRGVNRRPRLPGKSRDVRSVDRALHGTCLHVARAGGALLLSFSACPVGAFLMLRRLSLTGDAMSHAILPGAAAGFLLYGLEIVPMTIGGLVAVVALGAGAAARLTVQKEDASMAPFYLVSLSIGVAMVSLRGSSVDLMHVLFGTVLALSNDALWLIGLVTCMTLVTVAVLWRTPVAECLDPLFLRSISRLGGIVHFAFLGLVVLNLVAGVQALGTFLSVGLMVLPGAAARFWTNDVLAMCLVGIVDSLRGLLLSYHASLPSGPAIILSAGGVYLISLLAGPRGVLRPRLPRHNRKTA